MLILFWPPGPSGPAPSPVYPAVATLTVTGPDQATLVGINIQQATLSGKGVQQATLTKRTQ